MATKTSQKIMELSMYIDGEWRKGSENQKREIINPANGEVIAEAAEGTVSDTRVAIQAARKAFDQGNWPSLSAEERAGYLLRVADKIDERHDELTALETMDNGKPLREAGYDVSDAAACFRYYAGLILAPHGETYNVPDNMQAMVIREPIGVCGLIVPWNYPLLMSVWKIAPALAAGNTIVYKPSELTPVTPTKLFEIFEEIGLPRGVANMVMGAGETVGNEIAVSDDVDMISFTGGTDTGRHIMKAASGNMKKISLELGGKSPNIIFADTDLENAVDFALFGIYAGAGQICSAGSRILVEKSIKDAFIARFVERANKIKVGPGDDPQTEMGPLVSQEQLDKVLRYIEIGKAEGAEIACGGYRLTDRDYGKGFFVAPTAFIQTKPDMRIVQEEIFGPVAVFQTFKDEAEAVKLANDTKYGLAGGVFTRDAAKAMRVIKKVRAGITWVNTYHGTYNEAPWHGYKQSGIGSSLGTYGLDEFLETKQINFNLNVEPIGWFSD
ncbi:betaine-aldehyde dehydrogenase [Sporolactobacillus putidus]|uniref:Betaine-aldehyde dehydrogenase n=1 Tax=Sporolactobacillus putidus TaxID=492735 RepID=A0A917S505_9BACL|nr:betaine-aldehyde dehydrogenase [Sporolactobacillus putidus]